MNCDIPSNPNPALTERLLSDDMHAIVEVAGEQYKIAYQAKVAKGPHHGTPPTPGQLAASARVDSYIGGEKNDRWEAILTVGEGVEWGASHEFGANEQRHETFSYLVHGEHAAHDLTAILEEGIQ